MIQSDGQLALPPTGSIYKKKFKHFAPSFHFLGIADPTPTCCQPVLLAHAAYLRPTPTNSLTLFAKLSGVVEYIQKCYANNLYGNLKIIQYYAACMHYDYAEAFSFFIIINWGIHDSFCSSSMTFLLFTLL